MMFHVISVQVGFPYTATQQPHSVAKTFEAEVKPAEAHTESSGG
jgi:hypothetical protein